MREAPRYYLSRLSEVERMIYDAFGDDGLLALAVSHGENGTRQCDRVSPMNSNGTFDIGLFQLNSGVYLKNHKLEDLKDCAYNIRVARDEAYARRGNTFDAWVVYWKGLYVKSYNYYVELLTIKDENA